MRKISVYRDFDIILSQNGKYYASSEKLRAYLGFSKAVTDISEVKDAIDVFVDSVLRIENHENLEMELMDKYNNFENNIYQKKSKNIQRILLAVIIAIVIAILFIIQGMLSGLETKTMTTSTQTYKNIALASRTFTDENHYPYVLNSDKVYEPLIDENNINDSIKVKYIEDSKNPYATVETKVRKQFYHSSKNPLTNLGRKLGYIILSPSEMTLKTVTVFQPENYKNFVDIYDR